MCGNPAEDESEIPETPCCTRPVSETNIDKNSDDKMLEESNPWLPWFYRKLNQEITKNIELHVCGHSGFQQDGTPLESIVIFIH